MGGKLLLLKNDTTSVAGDQQSPRATGARQGQTAEDVTNQGKGFKPYLKNTRKPLKEAVRGK